MKLRNKQNDRKKKTAISAKWRLILTLILLTVVSIVFVWAAQNVFIDSIYIRIKKKELRETTAALAETDTEDLVEKITEYGKSQNFCIAYYSLSEDGKASYVYSYESRPFCSCPIHDMLVRVGSGKQAPGVLFADEEAICSIASLAIKASGFCYLRDADAARSDKTRSTEENLTAVRVSENGASKNVIVVNTSIVPVSSTVETLNNMMIYLSAFVVLGAVIFALLISLWITKPIEDINESAKKLAQRDYDVRFDGKGYREIEELSETLNYAADELSKTDRLQKELVANISHDLRTPLTLITGYAEAMRDLPDEMTEENLQIIIDESTRMKALVNDVLDISKFGSGTENLTMESVPLTNCIESELTRYNKLRDREGYIIEFRYDGRAVVNGDYMRLMQVVYNLVNNAVNYAGPDKKVVVEQTVKDGRVRISVTDHGEGISPEDLPKIWDRYYKVEKTHRRATVGSGLGLSIVKGIVTAHGGSYGVESTVGQGSTFWFELDMTSYTPSSPSDEDSSDADDPGDGSE